MTTPGGWPTTNNPGGEPIPPIVVDETGKWLEALDAFFTEPSIQTEGRGSSYHTAELVHLDLAKPDLDSFAIASILSARFPEIVLVLMSTSNDAPTEDAVRAPRACALLVKGAAFRSLLPMFFRLFPTSARRAGAEAMEKMTGTSPGIVFMDIFMPEGAELTKTMKPGSEAPRAVCITSQSLELTLSSLVDQTVAQGFGGYCSWNLTWKEPK